MAEENPQAPHIREAPGHGAEPAGVVGAPEHHALPTALGLDAPLSEIIDRPAAYDALLSSVGAHDQAKADDIRRGTQWTRGRTVRQLLMFTPPSMLDDVDVALAAARPAPGVAR